MDEFVLGTGQQQSVRHVVSIIEKQLLRTHGVPRKILARAASIEVAAERPDFKGPFESFSLRVRAGDKRLQALKEVVDKNPESCSMKAEEGGCVLTCPANGAVPSARVGEVVDALCRCLQLPEVWRATGEKYRVDTISVELLFQAMVQYKASDVHLSPGLSPIFRIDCDTHHSEIMGPLSAVQIRSLIEDIAPPEYWKEFVETKQSSFNYHQAGLGYARVSAFVKSGAPHCTFRYLPETIPSFEELNVPRDTMEMLSNLHRGLFLVTGMTGSGKTTTVAAVIDWINSNKPLHILTIENPVEYVHVNKKAIVSQRNLGADVRSFGEAVTGALRHDPDVVLIGEMRDPDTIRAAINAAATGHLVVSTLHSNTAPEVINRVVSFFDPVERDLVKLQLRDCLKCVICQRLVPKIGGGRLPALEILFNDIKAIADGISAGDTDTIRIGMQQTVSHSFLFENYLYALYKQGKVDIEHCQEFSTDQSIFDQLHMGTYSVPRLDAIKGKDHDSRS